MTKTDTNRTITVASVAEAIGKEKENITLPNGRVITTFKWRGEDLPAIDVHLRGLALGRADAVVFDGGMPAWLGLALIHGAHPAWGSLNDPRLGPVGIGCQEPSGSGTGPGLTFTLEDRGDFVLLEFSIEGGVFDVADLDGVVPPEIPGQKGLVISGRGPNWLSVSLAMAYHAKAKWVGMYQPGVGATVAMTHDPVMTLGTVVEV